MGNKLPSEFAILCNTPEEAQICIDWTKRNNVKLWSDLPFTADRCYFLKTKHNDYFFSTVKDGLSLIPLTSLTEEQVEIVSFECIKPYPEVEIGEKGEINELYPIEWYKKYTEYWKPIYRVKTQREIDHELIDECEKEFMKAPIFDDFFDYLKENNYAIIKREYEN